MLRPDEGPRPRQFNVAATIAVLTGRSRRLRRDCRSSSPIFSPVPFSTTRACHSRTTPRGGIPQYRARHEDHFVGDVNSDIASLALCPRRNLRRGGPGSTTIRTSPQPASPRRRRCRGRLCGSPAADRSVRTNGATAGGLTKRPTSWAMRRSAIVPSSEGESAMPPARQVVAQAVLAEEGHGGDERDRRRVDSAAAGAHRTGVDRSSAVRAGLALAYRSPAVRFGGNTESR